MKKVALITGGNKGLGFEIGRQLGRAEIIVVLGSRDFSRGQSAASVLRAEGIDAHAVALDVTSESDIGKLEDYFVRQFGRVDILVNNAGILLDDAGPVTEATLRTTFETNVVAPFAITRALLPLLEKAPSGRIVNHSSRLGSLSANALGQTAGSLRPAYNSSKAALNMLTVVLAKQLAGTRIKVNAAHPGWVRTEMGTAAATMDVPSGALTAVQLALLPDDGPTGGFFHLGREVAW